MQGRIDRSQGQQHIGRAGQRARFSGSKSENGGSGGSRVG